MQPSSANVQTTSEHCFDDPDKLRVLCKCRGAGENHLATSVWAGHLIQRKQMSNSGPQRNCNPCPLDRSRLLHCSVLHGLPSLGRQTGARAVAGDMGRASAQPMSPHARGKPRPWWRREHCGQAGSGGGEGREDAGRGLGIFRKQVRKKRKPRVACGGPAGLRDDPTPILSGPCWRSGTKFQKQKCQSVSWGWFLQDHKHTGLGVTSDTFLSVRFH